MSSTDQAAIQFNQLSTTHCSTSSTQMLLQLWQNKVTLNDERYGNDQELAV